METEEEQPASDLDPSEDRLKASTMLAMVVAGSIGFIASDISPVLLAVLVGTGIVCGLICGKSLRTRLLFSLPFVVACLGMAYATCGYVEGRSRVFKFELLLPFLIGASPGILLYFIVVKGVFPRLAQRPPQG
jgi:hypothetical protein